MTLLYEKLHLWVNLLENER